jgi:hypothetical protein
LRLQGIWGSSPCGPNIKIGSTGIYRKKDLYEPRMEMLFYWGIDSTLCMTIQFCSVYEGKIFSDKSLTYLATLNKIYSYLTR